MLTATAFTAILLAVVLGVLALGAAFVWWKGRRPVASVRIDTTLLFSDVFIETTGGGNPIRCAGHRKKDAVRMKAPIEEYQAGYYRQTSAGA